MWFLSVICHLMTKNLDTEVLKSIAQNYDLFFIDLWGVVHNGVTLHPKAIEALVEIDNCKKKYVLLTNAPRPNSTVKKFLKKLGMSEISELQEFKTGKLISWSCEVGPIIAGETTAPFTLYASKIGLAFQIFDDILDVTSSSKTLGKNVGKDKEKNKATFVSKLGLDNSKKKALELVAEACEAISVFEDRSKNLCQIANFIVSRQF